MQRLCERLGLGWDQVLGDALPASRYTMSAPDAEKWRRHETEIAAVWPGLAQTAERAEAFAARHAV
jgi:hypothetical protein